MKTIKIPKMAYKMKGKKVKEKAMHLKDAKEKTPKYPKY